jgi:ankyrin repeat protein
VYMLQLTTGKSYHMQTGETPLHLAARRGCLDVMEHLLENGADVNAENQVLDLLRRAYCYL